MLETLSIQKEIQMDISIERVFTALTDSEEIPQFFPLLRLKVNG